MPDRNELGKRIKQVREEKHLTLKNIEASAKISATHISEIERGKTSPTLGALIRIADALEKDPAYFIEEEDLGDISLVTLESRIQETLEQRQGFRERLTSSIPGGRLQACVITLNPGGETPWRPQSHRGNESVLVLEGDIEFRMGQERHILHTGDSVCFSGIETHSYAAKSESPARMLWVSTTRERL